MGQSQSQIHTSPSRQSKQHHILVDLDNITFFNGQLDANCLKSRVNTFVNRKNVCFFSNPATYKFLQHSNFEYIQYVNCSANNEKDSADHMMIERYIHLRASIPDVSILVVTHDKVLARLIRYFGPFGPNEQDSLSFGTFGTSASSCDQLFTYPSSRFDLTFNNRDDIDSFMTSLQLLKTRISI